MQALVKSRPPDLEKVLWVVGCSITHGTGVLPEQRYGQLISNRLSIPAVFLTSPGSSIEWAADQILRSDIKENDLVVWGITSTGRFPYYQQDKVIHLRPGDFRIKQTPAWYNDFSLDAHHTYKSILSILQVKNYLEKVGCKFAFGTLLPCIRDDDNNYQHFIENLDNTFVGYSIQDREIKFVDLGTDDLHPGPKHHQLYADQFLKALNL